MDVGFSDATGKIFKVTKFDFVIRRDHGFEAGEYDLKIKREDDGVQMGQTIRLVLKGDNPIVDRRAIVFAGDKPKSKKVEADKPADEEKKDEPAPAEPKKADEGERQQARHGRRRAEGPAEAGRLRVQGGGRRGRGGRGAGRAGRGGGDRGAASASALRGRAERAASSDAAGQCSPSARKRFRKPWGPA